MIGQMWVAYAMTNGQHTNTNSVVAERRRALLERLVEAARSAPAGPWERFTAVRVGLAGVVIYRPGIEPITAADMADLDALAADGSLELTKTPSGARLFEVTALGRARAEGIDPGAGELANP